MHGSTPQVTQYTVRLQPTARLAVQIDKHVVCVAHPVKVSRDEKAKVRESLLQLHDELRTPRQRGAAWVRMGVGWDGAVMARGGVRVG